uniref:F-box domain-containing protein n=1 Tax=Oryza brachyantha TaxID=4533 RepID=J3M9W3_ORYBR
MEEQAALPSPSSGNDPPATPLYEITRRIPCKPDRVRMLTVSRSWRTSLREPPVRPLPPQLPWLLRPSSGGPTFSCLLSGADEGSVHRFRVPVDLPAARYFGSYDGGWLAYGHNLGHTLVNLCNGRRFRLPEVVPCPWPTKSKEFAMIMLAAATLSSPPSYTDDRCFGADDLSGVRHTTFSHPSLIPYPMAIRPGLQPWWESFKHNLKNQGTLIVDKIWKREEHPDAMQEERIKMAAFELDDQRRARFMAWARAAVNEAKWKEPRLGPVLKLEFDDPLWMEVEATRTSSPTPSPPQTECHYLVAIGIVAVAGYVIVKYWLWR